MTRQDNPLSFKRLGRRTCHPCVSSSPSKIPYVGFSPVRLQAGLQPQPSPRDALGLYAATAQAPAASMASCKASRPKPVRCSRSPGRSSPEALGSPAGCIVPPGHRLLWPHPSLSASPAGLCIRQQVFAFGRGREVPQFTLRALLSVPPPVPRRTGRLQVVVASPPVVAFAQSARARHPLAHASRFARGCVTRLQSSLYAAARGVARPSPTRAFTVELSSHESPHWNVEHNYAGKQPIPAAGLSPAGHAALWAASRLPQRREGLEAIPFPPGPQQKDPADHLHHPAIGFHAGAGLFGRHHRCGNRAPASENAD